MGQKSSQKEAIQDMMEKLAGVFKKYTRESRRKAWDKLTSAKGKKEVGKILTNPYRPANQFRKLALLDFREWMEEEEGLDDFFRKIKQKILQNSESEQGRISFRFPNNYQSLLGVASEPTTIKLPTQQGSSEQEPMRLAAHYDPLLETKPDEKQKGAVLSLQTLNDPGWKTRQWNLFKKIIRQSAGRFGAELGYLFEIEVFLYLIKTKKLEDRDEDAGVGVGTVEFFEKKRDRYLSDITSKVQKLQANRQEAVDLLYHMVLENAKDLAEQIYRRSQQILRCNPDQVSFSGGRDTDWADVRQNPADITLFCTKNLDSGARGKLGWSIKFTTEHKVHIASLRPLPAYKLLGGGSDKQFEKDLNDAMSTSDQFSFFKDWRLAVIDLLGRPAEKFQDNPSKFVALLNDLLSGVRGRGRYDTMPAVVNYARRIRGGADWSGYMQKDFIATTDPKAKLKARPDATVDVVVNNTYVKLIYHRPGGSRSGTAITFEPRSDRVIVKVSNLTAGG